MEERTTISFLGVKVDTLGTEGLYKRVLSRVLERKRCKVMYVNADCMLLSLKDRDYRRILNNASLVYADGTGVVLGARLWGHRLPGRSTGADFMPGFCKGFAGHGLSIYLLGAKKGVAEEAAECLLQKIPDLKIAGTFHGYFRREETGEVVKRINAAQPDIVLVGLGAPYQEKWIDENADALQASVVWGVGGLFDFLSGRTRRGPQCFLDNGFEWFCRLITEPRRLWYRYLVGNTKFIFHLLWHKFIDRKDLSH